MYVGCLRHSALALTAVLVAAGCGDDKLNKKKPAPPEPGTIGAGCQTDADCYSGDCVGGKCAVSDTPMTATEICALYVSASINTDGPALCVQGTMGNANDLDPALLEYACRPGMPGYVWGSKMLTAVAESRLRVTWSMARECLSTTRYLRATQPGIALLKGTEWTAAKDGVCSNFYDGNIPPNGACKDAWDCPKDRGCFSDAPTTPGSSFCLPKALDGQPCSLDFHACAEGLRCTAAGTCGAKLNNGQPCEWADDCGSGYCDIYDSGNCLASPVKTAGESCDRDAAQPECGGECMTCRSASAGGSTVCQNYAGTGEYCDDWFDCLPDLGCTNHVCGTASDGGQCGFLNEAVCAPGLHCLPVIDCTRFDGDPQECGSHTDNCIYDDYYGYCDGILEGNVAGGQCFRLPTSGACVVPGTYPGSYCAPGYYCDSSDTCQPLGRQDAPCSDTQPCDDGLGYHCYPNTCVRFCEVIEDCPAGQFCDPGDESTPPRCLPINETSCGGDFACPAGKYCDFPGSQCFVNADETTCANDSECLWYVEGECVAENGCDAYTDETACAADTAGRCAWVEAGTCDPLPCDYTDEPTCNDDANCWWSSDYDGCYDLCWEFDYNETGCTGNPVCIFEQDTGYCWSGCSDSDNDRAACTSNSACAWEPGTPDHECVGSYDCGQHMITDPAGIATCESSGPCVFDGAQYCDMLDPDAMGACAMKKAVGETCLPDNVDIFAGVPSDSAAECAIGYATWVGPTDYDYKCSVAPNPPIDYTGCLNYTQDAQHALINLVWLFGCVWFVGHRRNKRR